MNLKAEGGRRKAEGENPSHLTPHSSRQQAWERLLGLLLWSLYAMCVLLGIVLAVFSLTWSAVCWVFWLPGRVLGLVR